MEIFANDMLRNAALAWLAAQVLKTIIFAVVEHRLDLSRLLGDGGMPSGHSATAAALATTAGLQYGMGSSTFAIAAVLAIIVMHDAMSVRLEAGKHAKAINGLTEEFHSLFPEITSSDPEVQLKEFLGHTPMQVLCGALLGLLIALLFS